MQNIFLNVLLYLFALGLFAFLLFTIYKIENKSLLHKICSVSVALIFIYVFFKFANYIFFIFMGRVSYLLFLFSASAIFFLPSTFVLLSILLIRSHIRHISMYVFVFLPPVVSTILLDTTKLHGLFLKHYNLSENIIIYGPLYYIHCTWQLFFCIFAIFYMTYYSLKYTNCLSKQILLVIVGVMVPILLDVLLYVTYVIELPVIINNNVGVISYCVTGLCLTHAINRYRFLDIVPIAVKSVVEHISDSFIVVDYKCNILEINRALKEEFNNYIQEKGKDLFTMFKNPVFLDLTDEILKRVHSEDENLEEFEFQCNMAGECKYFSVEVTPIYIKKQNMATLILLKNITQHKQILKLMEENNNQLIEKARLIFLNQLIGGIAHNIKSPLMSSAGGILVLEKHSKKMEELFQQLGLYKEYPEYEEILKDMVRWENIIKQYLVYISDVITAVKEQAVSLNGKTSQDFTINQILDKITLLMGFELKRACCVLNKMVNLNNETKIEGDITALTQILNNIIINAIQAYKNGGTIDLIVSEQENFVVFLIKDYGKGIDKEIQDKLFCEMVTTKGKDGTGLGLYIANIAVKGQFRGSIRVESEVNKGTSIYVSIPKKRNHE